jgi:hypothetical protein
MIRINDFNQQREFIINAKIVSIAATDRLNKKISVKHPNGTPYRIATAEVTYPSGKQEVIGSSIFSESLRANPDAFMLGATVQMAVQMDGEYAGFSKLELPTLAKFDVSIFAGMEENVAAAVTTEA